MKKKNKLQHFTWMSNDRRKREILCECMVTSWKNPRKEIEAHIKKEYRKDSNVKIHRIIDEEKVNQCPRELLWNSFIRQDCQGRCTYCGYDFVNFVGREKNQPDNFKYCLGFGSSNIPGRDKLIILYECPECFEKTYFHVSKDWLYLFGGWIVSKSIHL